VGAFAHLPLGLGLKAGWSMPIVSAGGVFLDPGGPVTRFPGVVLDITERKRAEEALKDADRRKDEFLALLAHELRNPLAPLRNGLLVTRLAGANTDVTDRARAMMDRQLAHMVRLIDDLLDVSRISRGKMELRRERVLLAEVIANAVETSRPAVDAGGHTFEASLPTEPVYLDADLTRLAQVFGNLLTDSAKKRRKERLHSDGAPPVGGERMAEASRGTGDSPAQAAKRKAPKRPKGRKRERRG
jgi:signal transduction histidine kinase